MAQSREMKFLTGLKKDFKRHGHHFYKIPDAPMAQRFMIPRPFDCYVGMKGESGRLHMAGMEAKFLDSAKAKAVKFNDLRETQHVGLAKVIADGGLGWVFYQIKFGREMRMYFWEYREFTRLCEKHGTSKVSKIPMAIIESMGHVKGFKNRFDVLEYKLDTFERSWEIAEEVYG